jgi:hypothetical protein
MNAKCERFGIRSFQLEALADVRSPQGVPTEFIAVLNQETTGGER